ncbi:MAG: V-type ATP synthase subunit F [Gammaproteobacteria bacterium]|nr:V-type ATP synthase subunit F [Gammaproteobacteria bacterium]
MPAPIFIGDEVSAAAYRLAGARACVPAPAEIDSILQWACEETDLVLITAEYAALLPPQQLTQAQAALDPLLLVVPDVRGHVAIPDLAAQLRGQLGVAT